LECELSFVVRFPRAEGVLDAERVLFAFDEAPYAMVVEGSSVEAPRTVLVVDDNLLLLNSIERILQLRDWSVLTADSPDRSLAIWEKRRGDISLLLTDVDMPGMSGAEMVELLEAQFGLDVPVFFMSGRPQVAAEAVASRDDVRSRAIEKPFDAAKLYAWLEELVLLA
jgi:CheY-like chemotaxis protein